MAICINVTYDRRMISSYDTTDYIDGLMQDCSIPSASSMAILQSCTKPSLCETRQIWGIWKLGLAYSPETPNLGPIGDVLYRVTLKFDGWPWKTIGHLSFAVSSFVQHFIAIGEFKLELQSGNAHFGSNSTIFRAVWPWNLMDDLENQ